MRASALLTAGGGIMVVVALAAGCDLVFNGNEGALVGVIGASVSAVALVVIGWIARHFENE